MILRPDEYEYIVKMISQAKDDGRSYASDDGGVFLAGSLRRGVYKHRPFIYTEDGYIYFQTGIFYYSMENGDCRVFINEAGEMVGFANFTDTAVEVSLADTVTTVFWRFGGIDRCEMIEDLVFGYVVLELLFQKY